MTLRIYHENELTVDLRQKLLLRQYALDSEAVRTVETIILDIKMRGEAALREYTWKFDGVKTDKLFVEKEEIDHAEKILPENVKEAFRRAADNIKKFHLLQKENLTEKEIEIGKTKLGFFYKPVRSTAVYVPGGKASYPSSVLMGSIPASIAGVPQIMLVTPPSRDGGVMPAVLYAAKLAGVTKILKAGGAQGVGAAAFLYGAEIIVGPGNRYVTAAKGLLTMMGVVKQDLPAGPSEVIVIADESANPSFVASDMLSQAEHGSDSPAILLTTSMELALKVNDELKKAYEDRPERREMKEASIRDHSCAIVFSNMDEAVRFSNDYAPEHLELCVKDPASMLNKIEAAGSVFLGHYAPVALGDYYSGTNHVLPTGGAGRFYSGLGVDVFLKRITYQHPTKESLKDALPHIEAMSIVEGLDQEHGHSVKVRFENDNVI